MDLDWQNNFQQIKERGQYLLETEKWTDCRFLVGTTPNQKQIAAHKLILAMASPVFERMFYGNMPDEAYPIVIPDVQPDAFLAMLEYIYTDKINISSFDKACELCYVAKKYLLPHVVQQCTHYLWADLSPKNACRAYEFAKLFEEPHLIQSSMEIISCHTKDVLADAGFNDVEISTFIAILDQEKLNIDSELDLFNALLRYANERGMHTKYDTRTKLAKGDEEAPVDVEAMQEAEIIEEIKMEPDVSAIVHDQEDNTEENAYGVDEMGPQALDEVVVVDSDASAADESESISNAGGGINYIMDTQRRIIDEALIRQAVKKIRFLTLTPQQFAEGPARSKLLRQDEALAILIKISSPSINNCQMPDGFCTSMVRRNFYESRCPRATNARSTMDSSLGPSSSFAAMRSKPYPKCPTPSALVHNLNDIITLSGGDMDSSGNDARRSYCVHTVNPQFDYRNMSVTDCGLTFQVDTNIWIIGVQVPTQVLCGELMESAGFSERYMEILYAHIQDMQGSRLTYTHCTSRVRYDSLLEISFDRPVYIHRNQIYKVFVVFNKIGWYPMYSCVPDVVCNGVKFMFNVGAPSESLRDGLIRAIVFSTPREQAKNSID